MARNYSCVTSRSLSLTEAGRDFYEFAVPLISDLEAAELGLVLWLTATATDVSPCSNSETGAYKRHSGEDQSSVFGEQLSQKVNKTATLLGSNG